MGYPIDAVNGATHISAKCFLIAPEAAIGIAYTPMKNPRKKPPEGG
jgi:hypothetical protein